MRWRRKEEISRLEAKAKDHFSFIDFHQFPEANEKNWNMIFFIIKAWNFLIKIYLPLISHAKTLNDRKEFFFSWIERVSIDWNISINIHLSLSRNWSRSFSHTHTQKIRQSFSSEIPGLKIFQKLQRRYFRRLITNYSELLIFQFESYM